MRRWRRRRIRWCSRRDGTTLLGPNTTWQNSNPAVQPKGTVVRRRAEPEHVALAVGPGIPVSDARVPLGAQEQAAVHRHRIGRGRSRAHLDVRHHRPDAVEDLQAEAADRPGLLAARQRERAGAVGILLRSWRHRPQPRQHDRRRQRRQQLGLLGQGQPELVRSELGCAGAEAHSAVGRRRRRARPCQDRRSDQVDAAEPSGRELLRAGASRARRAVQSGRQQRLQRREPARLQQRRGRRLRSASRRSPVTARPTRAANTRSAATTSTA